MRRSWLVLTAILLSVLIWLLLTPAQERRSPSLPSAVGAANASQGVDPRDSALHRELKPAGEAAPVVEKPTLEILTMDSVTTAPITGVLVSIEPSEASQISNAEGWTIFTGLESLTKIRVHTEASAGYLASEQEIELLDQKTQVRVGLEQGYSGRFRLLLTDGTPAAGVVVRCPSRLGRIQTGATILILPPGAPLTVTDAEGRFTMSAFSGSGNLHFEWPAGALALASVRFQKPQEQERELRMNPTRSVLLRVHDLAGKAVPGARIGPSPSKIGMDGVSDFVGFLAHHGRTNEQGEFMLEHVGRHYVKTRIEQDGYAAWEGGVPDGNSFTVVLEPQSILRFQLRTEEGAAPINPRVLSWAQDSHNSAQPSDDPDQWSRPVVAADGSFVIASQLHSGLNAVLAWAEGCAATLVWPVQFKGEGNPEVFVLGPEARTSVELMRPAFLAGAELTLRLQDARRLTPFGARPRASDGRLDRLLPAMEWTLRSGEVAELHHLLPSEYGYEVRDADLRLAARGSFRAGEGLVRLIVPEVSPVERILSGRLLDGDSEAPLVGAEVELRSWPQGVILAQVVTDGDGKWNIVAPEGVDLALVFAAHGRTSRRLRYETAQAHPAPLITRLYQERRFNLTFVRDDGMPTEDCYLSPVFAEGGGVAMRSRTLFRGSDPSHEYLIGSNGKVQLNLPLTRLELVLFRDSPAYEARVFFDAASAPDLPQEIRIP